MSLKDRFKPAQKQTLSQTAIPIKEKINIAEQSDMFNLREKLNILLLEKINSTPTWMNYDIDQQNKLIKQFIENQLTHTFQHVSLSKQKKDLLIKDLAQSIGGYGPLDEFFKDTNVSEIHVNGINNVLVKRNGKLQKAEVTFKDPQHLKTIIEHIAFNADKKLEEKDQIINFKLPDGPNINIINPPTAVDGPYLSIKKIKKPIGTFEDLIQQGMLTKEIQETLSAAVKLGLNIIISGTSNYEKNSLLNCLVSQVNNNERIIAIDISKSQQGNLIKLISSDKISRKDLLLNAINMQPDRIVAGEDLNKEVLDIVMAMNNGINGCILTSYSDFDDDTIPRLETLCQLSGTNLPEKTIKSIISKAINLIIHISKTTDNSNRITSVNEILGADGNTISMQKIFSFENGEHISTGIKPKFIGSFKENGLSIPVEYFNKERKHSSDVKKIAKNSVMTNKIAPAKQTEKKPTLKNRLIRANKTT